jgi:hypothetical protein
MDLLEFVVVDIIRRSGPPLVCTAASLLGPEGRNLGMEVASRDALGTAVSLR